MSINWNTTEKEAGLIRKIAARAMKELNGNAYWSEYKKITCIMDVSACHLNGAPMDLQKLLEAEKSTFLHDITGIAGHIDRKTGRLKNHFSPRTTLTLKDAA